MEILKHIITYNRVLKKQQLTLNAPGLASGIYKK